MTKGRHSSGRNPEYGWKTSKKAGKSIGFNMLKATLYDVSLDLLDGVKGPVTFQFSETFHKPSRRCPDCGAPL
jgi:hypothetical protein